MMTRKSNFILPNLSLVALAYTAIAILITWPVGLHLFKSVAGFEGRDSFQWVWFNWWGVKSLLTLQSSPAQVSWLYYPQGAYHSILLATLFVPIIALPFTLIGSAGFAYNVMFLTSFILGGTLTYLLAFSLTRRRDAAFVAGVIFILAPNRMGHAAAGHLLLITTWALPLFALAMFRLIQRPLWRWVMVGVIALTALTLTQPLHLAYFALPFSIVYGGVVLLRPQGFNQVKKALPYLVSMAGLTLLLLWPFFGPLVQATLQGTQDIVFTNAGIEAHSTDLLAFVLPSPYHPFWYQEGNPAPWFAPFINSPRDMEERLAYLGVIPLGLAVWAVIRHRREALVWLLLTLLAAILAMGPYLKIFNHPTGVSLPYYGLMDLPFFSWSRTPGRLNETTSLGLAILAAFGLADLLGRLKSIGQRFWVTIVIVFVIGLDYLIIFPFPMDSQPISDYYYRLAQENQIGAVLELPVIGSRRASNYAIYFQTVHQHPLAGGYIERDPPGTVELKEFLNQLVSPPPAQTVFNPPNETVRRAILTDMKIDRVIAHPALLTDRAARAISHYLPGLLGEAIFTDDDIVVYSVRAAGQESLPAWQILPDQDNWEITGEGTTLRLKKAGYLFIYAAKAGQVQLHLQVSHPSAQLTMHLNDTPLAELSLASTSDNLVQLPLRSGLNYLHLSANPAQDIEFFKIAVRADR